MLLVLLLAVACQSGSLPPVEAANGSDRDFVNSLVAQTTVVSVNCSEGSGWGSGVYLGDDLVATAAHVAVDGCELTVDRLTAYPLLRDSAWDVAVIEVPGLNARSAVFSPDPYVGQRVIAVGHPYHKYTKARQLSVTRGTLSAAYDGRYRIDSSFWFGSSGGGVWDEQGRLVGLSVEFLGFGAGSEIHADVGEFFVAPARNIRALRTKALKEAAIRRFTKDFTIPDLACRCGVPVPRSFYKQATEVTRRAQILRDRVGPLVVRSGYRTPDYNHKVQGAKRSQHLQAGALDLHSRDLTADELARVYEELIDSGAVPDGGVGVYPREDGGWLHIDIGAGGRRWRG